jgi:hypothetical protein
MAFPVSLPDDGLIDICAQKAVSLDLQRDPFFPTNLLVFKN